MGLLHRLDQVQKGQDGGWWRMGVRELKKDRMAYLTEYLLDRRQVMICLGKREIDTFGESGIPDIVDRIESACSLGNASDWLYCLG